MRALRVIALSTVSALSLGAIAFGVTRYVQSRPDLAKKLRASATKGKRAAKRVATKAKRRVATTVHHATGNHHASA